MDNVEFVNFQNNREPKLIDTSGYLNCLTDNLLDDLIQDCFIKQRELNDIVELAIKEKERREYKDQEPLFD